MEEQTWTIIWTEIESEFKLMSVSYWLATLKEYLHIDPKSWRALSVETVG